MVVSTLLLLVLSQGAPDTFTPPSERQAVSHQKSDPSCPGPDCPDPSGTGSTDKFIRNQ